MIHSENAREGKFISLDAQHVGANTLITIGFILITLGIGGSFFFVRTIEKFFWDARTKSVFQLVSGVTNNFLQEDDIALWQNTDATGRLDAFANDIKTDLPNVAAIKIYTTEGTIAWTDLQNVHAGYQEPGIETELAEVIALEQLVKSAGNDTKKELGKTDLLEIWTVIKDEQGDRLGFLELYFNSSDIVALITQIRYSIWGSIVVVLGIIIFLLRLAFRKQDELIIRQAHELSNVIEKSPIGIYIIDPKGTLTTVNQKMLELFGEPDAQKVLNQNVFSFPLVQRMKLDDAIREAILGTPFDREVSALDVKGIQIHRHYHGMPLFGEDGKTVERVLFMVEDITEQKKLEQNLAAQTKGLETVVGERTKALEAKVAELEHFQRVTIDRELRMTELKQQIERMRAKLESVGVNPDIESL